MEAFWAVLEVLAKAVGIILFVIFQIIVRLGILAIGTFLAACLGLLCYWLIMVGHPLLHESGLDLKWEAVRILEMCSWGMVVILLAGTSIGVFGWGVGCALEGP